KERLLPLIENYKQVFDFAGYIPVSAARRDGVETLLQQIVAGLPEGPPYFPPDSVTDQPERFLAAELIREQVLTATREEVPHSVAVLIDRWEDTPQVTRVYATVLVERPGQKGILIGAQGSMMKRIGTQARHEMERLFGAKIYLE